MSAPKFLQPYDWCGTSPKAQAHAWVRPPRSRTVCTVFWVKTQLKSKKSLSRGSRRKSKPESWGPLIFQSQEYPTQMLEDVLCKGTTFGMVTWHGQLKGRHTFQETRMQAACIELSQHDTHVHRCTLLVSHMIASGMRYAAHMQHGNRAARQFPHACLQCRLLLVHIRTHRHGVGQANRFVSFVESRKQQ